MSLTPPKLENIQEYWFNNNPALTHFMHSLSVLFDKGESYFMKSITAFMIENPEFKQDIIKFCKEERSHSLLHNQMNASFKNKKLLQKLEKRTGKIINIGTKFLSKKQNLAVTAALEHVTCSLATQLLSRPDLQDIMISDVKKAWLYHALEESSESHRTIAYKLYQKVSNNHLQRYLLMILGSFILSLVISEYWFEIMYDDTFDGFFEAVYILFIKNGGFLPNIIPQYLEWFSLNHQP